MRRAARGSREAETGIAVDQQLVRFLTLAVVTIEANFKMNRTFPPVSGENVHEGRVQTKCTSFTGLMVRLSIQRLSPKQGEFRLGVGKYLTFYESF
jgi:hypothetical protein